MLHHVQINKYGFGTKNQMTIPKDTKVLFQNPVSLHDKSHEENRDRDTIPHIIKDT